MSAVVQLSEARDSEAPTAAQTAREKAHKAVTEAQAGFQRDEEAWSRSCEIKKAPSEKVSTAGERLATLEAEREQTEQAIVDAINDGVDSKPLRAKLRELEESIQDARWQRAADAQNLEKASAAVDEASASKGFARGRIFDAEQLMLRAERLACFEALLAVTERFDARVRDLACQEAFRKFWEQAVAAKQGR